jgi:putative addiction module component (TIGR02574 family)
MRAAIKREANTTRPAALYVRSMLPIGLARHRRTSELCLRVYVETRQSYTESMTAHSDVVAAALTLPRAERAELAHKLLLSLDEPFDDPEVVETEWNTEVLRRLRNIEFGATVGIPLDAVREQFER